MRTAAYDFVLPDAIYSRIVEVQRPREKRDSGRLMVLHRDNGAIEHLEFPDAVEFLKGRPVYVNESKILRSRVWCEREGKPGFWAIFLYPHAPRKWYVRPEPGARLTYGEPFRLADGNLGQIVGLNGGYGVFVVSDEPNFDAIGTIPLNWGVARPKDEKDTAAYEPLYARVPGSITIPSAGVPFTEGLLAGLEIRKLWLHLGYEAYGQILTEEVEDTELPPERYRIEDVPMPGEKVVAVGTTVVRALETWGWAKDREGFSELTIREPYEFKVVDAILTNFHLPRETLTVMMCAFAGREKLLNAYRAAVEWEYDFSDYGDSMLIV